MRFTLLTLLCCILCHGVAEPAWGWVSPPMRVRDDTVELAGHRFGFSEWHPGFGFDGPIGGTILGEPFTLLECGPLGSVRVPFSAGMGTALGVGAAVGVLLGGWLLWRRVARLRQIVAARRGFDVAVGASGDT